MVPYSQILPLIRKDVLKKPDDPKVNGPFQPTTETFLLTPLRCVGAVLFVLDYNLFFGVVDKLCAILGGVDFRLCHKGLLLSLHYIYRNDFGECKVKKENRQPETGDSVVACGLCRHQLAEFLFESAFGHGLPEVLLHVFHVGAFAADASGGFGVGVVAFAAEFMYDVEPVECHGVSCGQAFFE